jgi:hypothetical protein
MPLSLGEPDLDEHIAALPQTRSLREPEQDLDNTTHF